MRLALLLAVSAGTCLAQLKGIVDLHVHCDPDSAARSIDALDLARLAQGEGMRALLLKNHNAATVQMAYIVHKVVPGVELYGSVVLNRALGGINPAAVEQAALMKGGYLRMVWMPTFDAGNEAARPNRPFVAVSKDGQLLPEVIEVLKLIAKYKIGLATGHSTPAEHLMLVHEGRKAGITKMIVTHPSGRTSIEQMKEAAADGAYIEFVYHSLLGGSGANGLAEYVKAIKAVGAEHCILTSDLGQADSPVHTAGWKTYLDILQKAGVTQAEIDLMARRNPARLLGLD
jgi:Family of unknown function (DUF6282)